MAVSVSFCLACQANNDCRKNEPIVESILKKLNEKTVGLKTYQAKIQWTQTQPLFETVTVRKGKLLNVHHIAGPVTWMDHCFANLKHRFGPLCTSNLPQ